MPNRFRLPASSDLRAITVILLLGVLGTGVMWWTNRPAGSMPSSQPQSGPKAPAAHPLLQPLAATPQQNSTGQAAPLVVHVYGAVGVSGVYRRPAGSRVIDAIEEAGGMALPPG